MDAERSFQLNVSATVVLNNTNSPQLIVEKTFSRKKARDKQAKFTDGHRHLAELTQPGDKAAAPEGAAKRLQRFIKAPRALKQTHLDLGQANFHCQTCMLCGMTYAPGEEADEKLHAAHHAKLVQGIRFHGWQNERVLYRDGLAGCVLLVHPTDPAPHLKKVKEIAELLEDQLGLVRGWLMSVPSKVYLYVSASKCVVGCVMLQTISSACLALPSDDGAASTADSCPLQLTSLPAHPARQLSVGSLPAGFQDRSQLHVDRQPSQGVFSVDWAPGRTQGAPTEDGSSSIAAGRSVFSEPARTLAQSRCQLQSVATRRASIRPAKSAAVPAIPIGVCHTDPVKQRKRSVALTDLPSSKRAAVGSLGAAGPTSKQKLHRQQDFLAGWLMSAQKRPSQPGTAIGSSGPPSPSASSCMGSPRARKTHKEAPDASTQDACSPCSARAAAQETSRQPLMCVTNEGEHCRDIASQAQLLPASQARAEADCPSSSRQACRETNRVSCPGTAESAERSCMKSGSAPIGVQLDTSAAASAKHNKDFNSYSADIQAAAARPHQCVLTEQPVNKQKLMPSQLTLTGEAEKHVCAMLCTQSEQHQHPECMQLESRPYESSRAQSQAQPVSDDAKQPQQLAQQQQSSVQANQALGAQPGREGRQGRPIPRYKARAPLLVDESRMIAAAAGVRVMWVAVGARRQGVGSKLLDLARCNFLAGYVVPRHQLAFSQPTEQGRSFAAAYTGSQKLLVYQ